MKEGESNYSELIKAMSFTFKQFRLYSEKHPVSQQALRAFIREIEDYLAKEPKIVFGSMQRRLVVDGAIVGEKDVAARDLSRDLERVGIEGIIFERGLELSEIVSFVNLMAMRPKSLQDQGGFKQVFESKQYSHIKLSHGKFQLVGNGQVVIEEGTEGDHEGAEGGGEGAGGGYGGTEEGDEKTDGSSKEAVDESKPGAPVQESKPLTSIADVINRLHQDRSSGEMVQQPIQLDCEKIVVQLQKDPGQIAQTALEETADPAQLEAMIRRIINFLVDGLIAYLVEQGKDITKALQRLAKELEKAVARIGGGEEIESLKKKIPEIFEDSTDELRIQMMVRTYIKNPEDIKAIKKLSSKLFKDGALRQRLGPALKGKLTSAGMSDETYQSLVEEIGKKSAKKRNRISVDPDELEELRRKAEAFDAGGGGGGGVVSLQQEVKTLQREKKMILDQKERVDSVIRNLAEGLLVVDKEGKVVLMNPAAEQMLGVKRNEKVGKHVTDGLGEEHLVAMTSGGGLQDSEGHVNKKVEVVSLNDETKRILQASTAVIENENGKTVGMVSVLSDVTKQKEVEELKSKFVSNVSHELRTPLVAIQKSLSLILKNEVGEVPPQQKKFLQIASRNIDRLSRLINDLLDVSKLESGRINLLPKMIPVRELVMHVLSTVETWAGDKGIKLETEISDERLEIEADADRLTQVITNLVGNAIKYTPENGSVTVEVKANIQDSDIASEPCVEIAVRDTGIGIAKEDQSKIFDKFTQVSLTAPEGTPSTGLGLTIAREIVQLHSGKIWVESNGQSGSRFVFRLPQKFKSPSV